MKDKKMPYASHRWTGDEDLSGVKDQFIPSIKFSIARVETVLSTGIIDKPGHPLFYSALLNILISTRDLMQKRYSLVGSWEEHQELFEKVKKFRDCLCHSDDEKVANKGVYFEIGWLAENYDVDNPYCKITTNPLSVELQDGPSDDVELYVGGDRCWVKKDIIKAYSLLKSYFEENLKDDIKFLERCLAYNQMNQNSKQWPQ
ncbi:hypothetical protein [Psychrobacter sp. UBA3962]|uniref:hypothetical protein n=1 Tax=Psychrobacter sp. UBA3962 TaxID=1947352 RepID=UPI0025EAC908|nr:hypothetical protein [Psychrobacter sp. UBA3962]